MRPSDSLIAELRTVIRNRKQQEDILTLGDVIRNILSKVEQQKHDYHAHIQWGSDGGREPSYDLQDSLNMPIPLTYGENI